MQFPTPTRLFLKLATPVILAAFVGWIFLEAIFVPVQAVEPSSLPYVHPALAKALLTTPADEYLPVVIEWPRSPNLLQALRPGDKLAQREQVIATLQNDTREKTASLMAFLQSQTSLQQAKTPRAFWISPIIILQARPALIQQLTQRTDISSLRLDEAMTLEPITYTEMTDANFLQPDDMLWNLETVHVGLTEQALGLDGTGVVVANLDSGVDWMHPALMTHYRGYRPGGLSIHYGNWHVSTNEEYTYPGDGNGHGTHTMGTIVGDDGQGMRTGVAPGAKWIAVKMFTNNGVTYESWVHDAFEWIIAPEGDPALAPDVLNNSWG
ncbi:MAG TPA: S8 family serine peptidase, partial [Anaerolineales bacterium]|nr:S8 family serine peptidase [Anaerolineales bacterium]